MATLILSTVGTLVGGPIGGAIGAAIGQQIDNRLFAPKGRKGPRLNELAVQTSSYGSVIPRLFGASRVAGTVIWATDLRESRRKVSNGKGQPKSTVYSYSASFAVALSARRIIRIGRIWADGKLLRGAGGDFKSETGFRLHDGHEGQPVDPLIASAEGIGQTPAYRGLAYAVFENFQLGDYGNRIPALSFEVIADEGDVSIGAILSVLGGRGVAAASSMPVQGFAATGDSARGVAETLSQLFPMTVRDDGALLCLDAGPAPYRVLSGDDLGARTDAKPEPRIARERRPETNLPASLSVAHYEPARDYQQGLQRVRDGRGGRRDLRIDMPVTLDAVRMKGHAAAALRKLRVERATAKIRLPWRYLDLAPGHELALPGDPAQWRVSGVTVAGMAIEAELVRHTPAAAMTPLASDPGRVLAEPDRIHGPTVFRLLDLPPLDDSVATAPRVAVAAAGAFPGWRGAALLMSLDDGASWQEAGPTAAPAVIGTAPAPLGPASAHLIDEASILEVELLNEAMQLQPVTEDALWGGANAALIGDELIQFRMAEPLGGTRYRLSGLLRGRRGTEWAISNHGPDESFVLVEADSLALLNVPAGTGLVRVMAVGMADALPAEQQLARPGRALLPLAPVHAAAARLANGDIEIRWIRRSRSGWRWLDAADAPLVEETERYRVTIAPDPGQARTVEPSGPLYLYTAEARAADLAAGAAQVTIGIAQAGGFGVSLPATLILSLH